MEKKCQVFTPKKNVIELLDEVGYIKNLYGKKIMENSCGTGNILLEIVERYIKDGLKENLPKNKIKKGLEQDICGVELDPDVLKECLINLEKLVLKFGLFDINWKIYNSNYLDLNLDNEFDFIVGNPPYLSYTDLKKEERVKIRNKYITCKIGKFDYCYAFIEESLNNLSVNGRLAYLIPNSIFKTVFGQELRKYMLPFIFKIKDYTIKKLFKVMTSSAILICENSEYKDFLIYEDVVKKNKIKISKKDLKEKWIFSKNVEINIKDKKFGDYFKVSSSIATLLNDVFVIKDFIEKDQYIETNNFKIEKELLREAFSPRNLKFSKKEYIIFPYKNNKVLEKYSYNEFKNKFPMGTKYLKSHKEKLLKRNFDKSARWYEYGRSQAIAHMNENKLLISKIITNEVNVYYLNKKSIPYSGFYIIPKKDMTLEEGKKILESEAFFEYVKKIGININGNSNRITSKDISDFIF